MDDRVYSDELNATAMGMTKKRYDQLCSPGGRIEYGMSTSLAKYDCHAAMIRATEPGIEQTRMMAKLRFIVARNLVNVQRPKKVQPSTEAKNTNKEKGNTEFITKDQPHLNDAKAAQQNANVFNFLGEAQPAAQPAA